MGMERATPPQCTVDGSCSGGAYSIQSCLLRHAAYITSFFSSRHQGVDLVRCGLTPHLLCEGATDRTHHASLGPLHAVRSLVSPPDEAVFVTRCTSSTTCSARPRSAGTHRLALVLHLLFISSSPPLHRGRLRVGAPSSTNYLSLVDLRVRSSGACCQSTGRVREHFSGTDARWDVRSHHIDPQLPVFPVSYYRWSLHAATFPPLSSPPHLPPPPHPPPLYLFSTLDTVTLPPSSISAPVSILTPAQSFPMRARASVTETRNAPPRRTMQDARCAGRRRDVEERGWMEGGYGGVGIGMERREEVGEEQGVGTEGGARRRE
ncbi:hypothetical protein B0H13DRAFT_2132789 [Mycena leptocephala]|nr:hypothetical protein B0H13DRAFT_2132789 [Mycena leptocephala]